MASAAEYFAEINGGRIQQNDPISEQRPELTKSHYFLHKLINAADKNASRKPGGYRYDDDVKLFASYLRNLAGPLAYDTLQRNLESALPSLSAINKHTQKSNKRVTEGVLRSNELLIYLKERNLPLVVSLSEDGTSITNRLQYDSVTNQIIGFVLPVSSVNGMPVPFTYKARTATEIISHFNGKTPIASVINVVMAQPLSDERVPPFCLLLFSSDNKYNSGHVRRRWAFIISELNGLGIKVLTFSSDSDPKYNSAMRSLSLLGSPSKDLPACTWFRCGDCKDFDGDNATFFVQDTVHIGSKMRNFLIKTNQNPALLRFGKKYYISIHHLQYLVLNFSKDKHHLTPSIVKPIDRQNFEETVLRICDAKVTELMRSSIPDSQATVKFLEIMRNVIDSYTDKILSPIQRVQKIWYAVFMLRIWRDYVVRTKGMKLKNNFISTNCYVCIELNAHSLVQMLLHLQKTKSPQMFLPTLMNSQTCESIFRLARSFTSTFSTVVNCSVKEMLCRISKIQMQNDIMNNVSDRYKFPRLGSSSGALSTTQMLPTLFEIERQIQMCKSEALSDALSLGLIDKKHAENFDDTCKIGPYIKAIPPRKLACSAATPTMQQRAIGAHSDISLKNYAKDFGDEKINETSRFVELVPSRSGRRMVVKKSSLCWLLRREYVRVSSDRLERVKSRANTVFRTNRRKRVNYRTLR